MKKLLTTLTLAPLAITACGGSKPAKDSKLVLIEKVEQFNARYQFDDTDSNDIIEYTKNFTDKFLEKENNTGFLPNAKTLSSNIRKFARTYEGINDNTMKAYKMDWTDSSKAYCVGNTVQNQDDLYYVGGTINIRTELESSTNIVNKVEGIEVAAIMSALTKDPDGLIYQGTSTDFKPENGNYFVINTKFKLDDSNASFVKHRKFYKFADGKIDAICYGK